MQGGAYAAKVIRRRVLGRPYEPFRYSDHGDVAVIGRAAGVTNISWLGPVRAAGRFPGLGAVARHPHLLPDRVLEPDRRPRPLGVDVPDPRSRRPADHGQGIAAADRGTRAAGPRADGARRRGVRRRRAGRARPGLGGATRRAAQSKTTTWRRPSPARNRSKALSRSSSGRRRSMSRSTGSRPARWSAA